MRERRAVFRLDGDFFSPVNERFSGEGTRFSEASEREREREREKKRETERERVEKTEKEVGEDN